MLSLLVDTGNFYYCVGKRYPGRKLDYEKYVEYCESLFGPIVNKIAYISDTNDRTSGFAEYLVSLDFHVVVKKPTRKKIKKMVIYQTCWLVEMTRDVIYCLGDGLVILGSSNMDLLPLINDETPVIAAGIPRVFYDHTSCEEIGEKLLLETVEEKCLYV